MMSTSTKLLLAFTLFALVLTLVALVLTLVAGAVDFADGRWGSALLRAALATGMAWAIFVAGT